MVCRGYGNDFVSSLLYIYLLNEVLIRMATCGEIIKKQMSI